MVAVALGSILSVTAGTAAATGRTQAECTGDVILPLEPVGIRLLNVPGQRSFGPIPIDLVAGTYTVTAGSFDEHAVGQLTQPQERWQIVADSGWRSPFTADIPDDRQTSLSTFVDQVIASPVTSITLQHFGEGGVNSVSPTCIGLTLTSPATAPDGGDSGGDVSPPPGEAIGDPVSPDDPDAGDPPVSDDIAAPTPDDDTTVPADDTPGDDPGDAGAPGDDIPSPADDGAPTDDGTPADSSDDAIVDTGDGDDDETTVEVDGSVELTPSLARTGPDSGTTQVLGLAMVLLGLGGLALVWTHRREIVYG